MRKVNKKTGCWEWQGSLDSHGYGQIRINKKLFTLPRLMGVICLGLHGNEKDVFVCHSCDNPKCFNPAHLFLGDRLANQRDMAAKGRGRKPREFPNQRDLKVLKLRNDGMTWQAIANQLNYTRSACQLVYTRFNKTYGQFALEGAAPISQQPD